MRRLVALLSAPALLALAAVVTVAGCRGTPRDPDVILLVVDTLRAQSMSVYGYDRDTTPNLEAFADDAVTYEKAISPGTWTVPAHASLLTGRWPSFHGAERVVGDRLLALPIDPGVPTLAEVLSREDWRTGAFVANTTYLSSVLGFARGFRTYWENHPLLRADGILKEAAAWLAAEPGKSFLFVNVLDPHEPYEPPPPFDTRFPGRDPSLGGSLDPLRNGTPLTPAIVAHLVSQYDGEIAFTDEELGKFFAELKKQGRYDSSLIFVTADHGELLGEHGLAGHGLEPFEPLVRVPLLVKYPGNTAGGTRIARRVSTMAIFATVFHALGIALPEGTQAVPVNLPQPVLVEDIDPAGRRVRAAYEGTQKLVEARTRDGNVESALYDLETDPIETQPRDGKGSTLQAALDAFTSLPRPVNPAPRQVIDAKQAAKPRQLGSVE
ncbi:sulfatase [Candidatus Binatia bacterium]|jgi:arylsulfatase A-like enzyme|nr:sulfatase [Candidatus Binatia bacterium]